MPQRSIGIFDSGIGGLTVFREIANLLPREDLIYLGDTARVPYGTKSADTVTRYALQNVRFLLEREIKLVVVACNTASAFALEALKGQFSIPILGVIEPGVAGVLRKLEEWGSKASSRIAVIGTEGTITSGAYQRQIRAKDPRLEAVGVPCPLFVPLVEEGWWENDVTERIARAYLEPVLNNQHRTPMIDALILGCTHYPLLKKTLRKVVGDDVLLVDSAEETARETAVLLAKEGLMRDDNGVPKREFYVTDAPERFQRLGELILGRPLPEVKHVEI